MKQKKEAPRAWSDSETRSADRRTACWRLEQIKGNLEVERWYERQKLL